MSANQVTELARKLRAHSIRMTSQAGSAHIGSCLSVADILAVLYADVLNVDPHQPLQPDRDRFIISKGHAAAVTYAALAERGFIELEELAQYGSNGGRLFGHVTTSVPGVEFSTGSLGHGLPVGTGMALAAKQAGASWRVFVVMSDGELDEGSNWEAILFAAHQSLGNLTAVVDYNGIQSLDLVENTVRMEPVVEKLKAFGWGAIEVNGHDVQALQAVLSNLPLEPHKPTAVIAKTIKGKGVSFMENTVLWHYRSPTGEELDAALREVAAT